MKANRAKGRLRFEKDAMRPEYDFIEGVPGKQAANYVAGAETRLTRSKPVIHADPDILGGTPVFVGTRVPFQALMDYIEAGHPLSDFLDDFPTVTRKQALTALEQAKKALLAYAGLAG